MRLFHFISSNYGLAALRDQRLKVSNLDDLNDPFELMSLDTSERSFRRHMEAEKKKFSQSYSILCFSKTWREPLMWSHYADRHSGMVLELDVDESIVNEIKYRRSRAVFDDRKHSSGYDYSYLATKYIGWSYEEEYRVF